MEHVFTESMFLVGFVIFIAAILVLDMLVIDRKAHVVSIKEAGSWTAVWIILALAFAVFIYFHGDMVHGIENFDDLKLIASRYASHLKLDPNDYEGSLQQYRHYMTISYISGYLIEKTLSVDNLFVMMMIFTSFGVNKKDYQHVLNWGILGAIVLRFVFIFAGAALISRFAWILLVFGGFLVYSGAKMFLNRNKKEEINALDHPVVTEIGKDTLVVSAEDSKGHPFKITFYETRFEVAALSKEADFSWALELKAAAGKELPFTVIEDKAVNASFDGFNYVITCEKGHIRKPESGSDYVFRIFPSDQEIVIDCTNARK